MSHDIIADALNQIMNAKKARKDEIVATKHSKLLLELLKVGKKNGYIEEFKVEDGNLIIKISDNLNSCKAIKPRYNVKIKDIDKKIRRFLPSRGFGILILSTSKGLLTHDEALEKDIGGQLLAYFY